MSKRTRKDTGAVVAGDPKSEKVSQAKRATKRNRTVRTKAEQEMHDGEARTAVAVAQMNAKRATKPAHPTQDAGIWLDKGAVARSLSAVRAASLFGAFKVGILGTQPVILHRFDEKSAREIEKGQDGSVKKKKKAPRDREAEVRSCAYMIEGEFGDDGARYGMPTAGFKHALVSTARHLDGLNMTQLRQQCFVEPDVGRLTEFWFDEMEANTDAVRIGGMAKTTTLRYRPYFHGWRCMLTVSYWKDVIQPQQILQCLETGGKIDGYGEWRPGKSNSGWAGTWVTISEDEFAQIQAGKVSTKEMVAQIQGEDIAA